MSALELMPCERCDEQVREVHCSHGRDLCEGHLYDCSDCQTEWAESLSYDADRDDGF